jgi:putative hydroxymethylpyrimidine transport system ATP-binding protein
VLTICNLSLTYPGYPPLATLSLGLQTGEQIALLGRSGTGKSTLLTAIIQGSPEIRLQTTRIAYLSQQPALLPWASVIDNVLLGFTLRGENIEAEDVQRAKQLLKAVDLHMLSERQASQLSGGQQARVALARALVEDADLVLLDEPFASLDRSTRIQMAQLCQQLLSGKTVILVTHDPRDAHHWLDRAMVLTTTTLKGPFSLSDFESDDLLIQVLEDDR